MRRLRLLLACLLLAAVSLHGMAGASVLPCAVGHGSHDEAAAASAHHGHHDGASPAHAHSGHDAGHGHAGGSHGPCAACAACCHGAAMNDAPTVPAFIRPAHTITAPPAVALRLRATPPPDKPPRA